MVLAVCPISGKCIPVAVNSVHRTDDPEELEGGAAAQQPRPLAILSHWLHHHVAYRYDTVPYVGCAHSSSSHVRTRPFLALPTENSGERCWSTACEKSRVPILVLTIIEEPLDIKSDIYNNALPASGSEVVFDHSILDVHPR